MATKKYILMRAMQNMKGVLVASGSQMPAGYSEAQIESYLANGAIVEEKDFIKNNKVMDFEVKERKQAASDKSLKSALSALTKAAVAAGVSLKDLQAKVSQQVEDDAKAAADKEKAATEKATKPAANKAVKPAKNK